MSKRFRGVVLGLTDLFKLTGGNGQIGIKDEPLSPASSHGSDSTDSMSSQVMHVSCLLFVIVFFLVILFLCFVQCQFLFVAPSQERSDLTGHYGIRLVGCPSVDSYKAFQFSKFRPISKISKPKCVSGNSDFNLCRFGLIHFQTPPPTPTHLNPTPTQKLPLLHLTSHSLFPCCFIISL